MRKKILNPISLGLGLLLATTFSCSEQQEEIEQPVINENFELPDAPAPKESLDDASNIFLKTDCNIGLPPLGPSTSPQSGNRPSSRNTIGTLDSRTAAGGYFNINNSNGSYGKYETVGAAARNSNGSIRYLSNGQPEPRRWNGTKPRVESFFADIREQAGRSGVLTGVFNISRLSNGKNDGRNRTCIIQSHAGGDITKGLYATGSVNAISAQFLLYAAPKGNGYELQAHQTDTPYRSGASGSRNESRRIGGSSFTLNFNQDYTFRYETGYNSSGIQFSKIKVGGKAEILINHTYTTKRCYTRYGAYGTGDVDSSHPESGLKSTVYFKNVRYCLEENTTTTGSTNTSSSNWDASRSLTKDGNKWASSTWSNLYYPSYGGDGNGNTRWASGNGGTNAQHYLGVSFGYWHTIKRAKVVFDGAISNDFDIYGYDGSWKVIRQIRGNTSRTVKIEGLNFRGYQFTVHSRRAPHGWISIHEFELYNH